ncbi:hypothetical protein FQN54_003123 [Arachnomyces sp. PD_36]|nr:hypothetical protein FQN54_003123 [Arachnomyces sp. PD_36]
MPSSTYDQSNFLMAAAASVKKRKREIEKDDNENAPIHTSFVPSTLQHLNSPFHYECEYTNHTAPASRYISPQGPLEPANYRSRPYSQPSYSRKRRQQHAYQQQQPPQHQWPGTRQSPGQKPHIPSNGLNPDDTRSRPAPMPHMLPIPTSSFNHPSNGNPLSSPAVSPKTTLPQYPTQPLQPYLGEQHHPPLQTSGISLPPPAPLLRPCHICHRRPTTRALLDAYADCELCGERTCYICLRECNGPDCSRYASSSGPGGAKPGGGNHTSSLYEAPNLYEDQRRRKVCSGCAVEGLTETGREVVRCFDCVRSGSASVPMPASLPMPSGMANGSGGGYGPHRGDPGPMTDNGAGNGTAYGPGPWNFRHS